MRKILLSVVAMIGLAALPVVLGQEPKADSRKDAQEMFKGYQKKLGFQKPVNEVLGSLKALEEIADEMHSGVPFGVQEMLLHRDPAVRRQAAKTLAAIGVNPDTAFETVEDLAHCLNDPDPEVVVSVLTALYRLGPYAKSALPKALEAFKSDDARIRRAAMIMFNGLLPDNNDLIPTTISALDDPDVGPHEKKPGLNSVSMLAMMGLSRCGPAAKDAAPKLVQIVKDKKFDGLYENLALGALVRVKPEEPFTLGLLREWLRRKNSPEHVTKATGFFRRLGSHGKPLVPELIAVLEVKPHADAAVEQRVKLGALSALQWIGPEARGALPAIRALSEAKDLMVRRQAAKTIDALEGKK